MLLLTKANIAELKRNYLNGINEEGVPGSVDHYPVVKLFTPYANATWLITEMVDDDTLFGLCDLGLGFPELGYVSITELKEMKSFIPLGVERDRWFTADKPLSEYTSQAHELRQIKA